MAEDPMSAQMNAAGTALNAFAQGPAREAADAIGESFERAGDRIAGALARAALDGEASFRRLAKTILEEAAKIALDKILPTGGGASTPRSGGSQGMSVVFNLGAGADAESIRRNQAQIAAQVARAAAYGSRNL